MPPCHFCLKYTLEPNANLRPGPNKAVLFPDGQKLPWKSVCGDCLKARHEWETQRNLAKIKAADEKARWHQEVFLRNEAKRVARAERFNQNRARIDARNAEREASREARELRQREADLVKMANLERQIDICTAALETLRKKYLSSDDKST